MPTPPAGLPATANFATIATSLPVFAQSAGLLLAWLADGALLVQDTPALTMTPHIVRACLGIDVEVIRQNGKPPFAMPA